MLRSLPMTRRVRRLLGILTLVLWVASGPIAMAFDGCAMMGAMCEAPCGMSSYIVGQPLLALAVLEPHTDLPTQAKREPAVLVAAPPTPPPKSALLSA